MLMLTILLATFIVSLISLIGIFFIGMKQDTLTKTIKYLVSFAVGGLLGGAFFHLLPESMESGNPSLRHELLPLGRRARPESEIGLRQVRSIRRLPAPGTAASLFPTLLQSAIETRLLNISRRRRRP